MFDPPENEDADDLTIDALVFTLDDKSIIVANQHDSDLHFYDVQTGEETKTLKGS